MRKNEREDRRSAKTAVGQGMDRLQRKNVMFDSEAVRLQEKPKMGQDLTGTLGEL